MDESCNDRGIVSVRVIRLCDASLLYSMSALGDSLSSRAESVGFELSAKKEGLFMLSAIMLVLMTKLMRMSTGR